MHPRNPRYGALPRNALLLMALPSVTGRSRQSLPSSAFRGRATERAGGACTSAIEIYVLSGSGNAVIGNPWKHTGLVNR